MKLYYFFEADEHGKPDYGDNYFVMSDSLESAQNAVLKSDEYKNRGSDISKMSYRVIGLNQVIHTETA